MPPHWGLEGTLSREVEDRPESEAAQQLEPEPEGEERPQLEVEQRLQPEAEQRL